MWSAACPRSCTERLPVISVVFLRCETIDTQRRASRTARLCSRYTSGGIQTRTSFVTINSQHRRTPLSSLRVKGLERSRALASVTSITISSRRQRGWSGVASREMELQPGIYEQIINEGIAEALHGIETDLAQTRGLDPADADAYLVPYLASLVSRALRAHRSEDNDVIGRQVAIVNALLTTLREHAPEAFDGDEEVPSAATLLLAIMHRPAVPAAPSPPIRPEIPLSAGALLVNGRGQPRIGSEIARELATADDVDLLCAFVKWEGLRILEEQLRGLGRRGCRLRVITTTYMGATDRRLLDALVEMGAQVKVSYETRTTRLHAKAWVFKRASGSLLRVRRLVEPVEERVLMGLSGMSESWCRTAGHSGDLHNHVRGPTRLDPAFEDYDPSRDGQRFDQAIAAEKPSIYLSKSRHSTCNHGPTSARFSSSLMLNADCVITGGTSSSWQRARVRPSSRPWTTTGYCERRKRTHCYSSPTAKRSCSRVSTPSGLF